MRSSTGRHGRGIFLGRKLKPGPASLAIFAKHLLLLTLAAGMLFSASAVRSAKVDDEKVAKIQAGCIFHMARLVTWPDSKFKDKDSPIVIGFIGNETSYIADYFSSQSGKYTAQGRKLVVKRFMVPEQKGKVTARVELFDKELRQTHILFIGFQGAPKYRILLEALAKSNVLTVGGASEFTDGGGMSALTVEKDKLVIRVNLASVNQSELKISAQFLQHAIIVKK